MLYATVASDVLSSVVAGPDKGFGTYEYKVRAKAASGSAYLDSLLSDEARRVSTKRTNVYYYDGERWLLAQPRYYQGEWRMGEGLCYFDGTEWRSPSGTF